MNEQYILAIDQGTSGTKSVIFTAHGELVAKGTAPLKWTLPTLQPIRLTFYSGQNHLDTFLLK